MLIFAFCFCFVIFLRQSPCVVLVILEFTVVYLTCLCLSSAGLTATIPDLVSLYCVFSIRGVGDWLYFCVN